MQKSITDYCNSITDDTVYWCMGDINVLPLTLNWLKSCELLNIPILYVALDIDSYNAVKDINPTVYIQQENHHVFVYKFIVGQQIMQAGKNWFYTDVDCVVRKDYRDDVETLFNNGADQICQSVKQYEWLGDPIVAHGEYNCGTGMFGMCCTDINISICEVDYLYNNGYKQDGTCQKFVNTTIKHREDTTIGLLNPLIYPTGHNFDQLNDWNIFHVTGKYAYKDRDNTKEYIGDDAKIDSLKHLGLWYI